MHLRDAATYQFYIIYIIYNCYIRYTDIPYIEKVYNLRTSLVLRAKFSRKVENTFVNNFLFVFVVSNVITIIIILRTMTK